MAEAAPTRRYRVLTVGAALASILLFWLPVAQAASQIDVYHFESGSQEDRYKALIEEFRCPKCLNTNIAGSDAPIAQDLRRTVHRLVVIEEMTDQEVRDYLQERYGDFVLYDPPFNARTWLIWVVPSTVVAVGLIVLVLLQRRTRALTVPAGDVRERVAGILDE